MKKKLKLKPKPKPKPAPAPGSIKFVTGSPHSIEVLRFEPDGRCFVRGELVESNFTAFEAFKSWCSTLRLY